MRDVRDDDCPRWWTWRDRRDYDRGVEPEHPAAWEWCGDDDFWGWPGPD
jgi:hypothetical protein